MTDRRQELFFRSSDGRLPSVAAYAVWNGDVVVLPDRRTGMYLGEGRVPFEGGV